MLAAIVYIDLTKPDEDEATRRTLPAHMWITLQDLAAACLAAGDVAAARGHAERALQIHLQYYPEEHSLVQSDRRLLAAIQAAARTL